MGKTQRLIIAVLICVVLVFLSACSKKYAERRPPSEKWILVTIQAMVETIDMKTREVTLRGPQGNLVTLEVDKSMKRLSEVREGDIISADYFTYMKAEFRDPTPEEMETPLVVLAEGGKALEGMPPGAAVGAVVQAVVTIESINRQERKVTIKGPRGKYITLPVEDQTLLQDMRVGEVGVLTYAEAVALSLKKINP